MQAFNLTEILFLACAALMIIAGFYCSAKLTGDHPLWVRLSTLSPALTAMAAIYFMIAGKYVAYPVDVLLGLSHTLQSLIVASRFSDKPWLDLRVSKP